MSFYRIYEYPLNDLQFRHIYVKRDRVVNAEPKERSILDCIDEFRKSEQSLSRAKKQIRDIILCNQFDYFCTFTFDSKKIDRYNYDKCRKYISKWFNNFKFRYAPDFRYLVVPEFHQDGAIHFHGMIGGIPKGELTVPEFIFKRNKFTDELERVPNTRLYMDFPRWRENAGFFNCSAIRDYQRCAFYVTKYITKDLLKLPKNSPVFLCSKNLKRPELVFDEDYIPMMFEPSFENDFVCTAFTDSDFNSQFFGSIENREFDIDEVFDDHIWFVPVKGEQLSL